MIRLHLILLNSQDVFERLPSLTCHLSVFQNETLPSSASTWISTSFKQQLPQQRVFVLFPGSPEHSIAQCKSEHQPTQPGSGAHAGLDWKSSGKSPEASRVWKITALPLNNQPHWALPRLQNLALSIWNKQAIGKKATKQWHLLEGNASFSFPFSGNVSFSILSPPTLSSALSSKNLKFAAELLKKNKVAIQKAAGNRSILRDKLLVGHFNRFHVWDQELHGSQWLNQTDAFRAARSANRHDPFANKAKKKNTWIWNSFKILRHFI